MQRKSPKAWAASACIELHRLVRDFQVKYRQFNLTRVGIDHHNSTTQSFFYFNDNHCDGGFIAAPARSRLPHANKGGLSEGKGRRGEKKDRSTGDSHRSSLYSVLDTLPPDSGLIGDRGRDTAHAVPPAQTRTGAR